MVGEVAFLELLKAAAAAETGSDIEERRGATRARKKVEENSLATVFSPYELSGMIDCGSEDVEVQVKDISSWGCVLRSLKIN